MAQAILNLYVNEHDSLVVDEGEIPDVHWSGEVVDGSPVWPGLANRKVPRAACSNAVTICTLSKATLTCVQQGLPE